MKRKVLLAYPPTRRMLREDRCQIPARNAVMSPPLPPMDLLSLAAVAEDAGCACRVADYPAEAGTADRFIRDLREFRPHYLLITVTTPTLSEDLAYCALAKSVLPGIITIARGAHFLKYADAVLERVPGLDLIIRGEPETTFREIVQGRTRPEIPGLTWRGPQGIINNPERPFIEDLDSLPLPARHLIDNTRYVRPDTGDLQTAIRVSRGCPHHCFFCLATPTHGAKVRMRSPGNILAEIRGCVERYGIHNFVFWSDFFTFDRNWALELCGTIERSGLEVNWSANTRASAIDYDMARAMKRAGCSLVSIGIESGNQEILNKIGKTVTKEQARRAVSVLKEAELKTIAYYLIGLPWDTPATVEETIRLSLELDSDYASFFAATPFPGTRFYDYAVENGLFDGGSGPIEEAFRDAYFTTPVKGHFLGQAEITALRREAEKRFLSRPGYILRNLRRVRSWRELANYAAAAASFMRNAK